MKKKSVFLCVLIMCFICLNGIVSSAGLHAYHGDNVIAVPERGITEDKIWLQTKSPLDDYAYSFAVLGDMQCMNDYYPDRLQCIFDWLVENQAAKNIKYVFNLGDTTNGSAAAEWKRAIDGFKKIDGLIPFSFVRGNHDTIETYDRFININEFGHQIDGSFDGTMKDTYKAFSVGDVKYLVLNVDLVASDRELQWAGEICDMYPDHNVIITTHIYMYYTGIRYSILHTKICGCENDSEDMWTKLVSKHKNIVLLLCGHSMSDVIAVRRSKGDYGNTVTQMLVDPQDVDLVWNGTGMVAMMYFSEDGKNVQVEYYSTVRKEYFLPVNQFSMTLDVVGSDSGADADDAVGSDVPALSGEKSGTDYRMIIFSVIEAAVIIALIISVARLLIKINEKKAEEENKT